VAVIALAAWPAVGSSSTWLTLTFAGLAMGMIVFIAASGLTLVFGLMDVLNFGHSLFIALGAYIATSVFAATVGWTSVASLAPTLAAVGLAMLAAMLLGGVFGLGFERVIVRPVYGQHLKQILVTIGGAIVGEELIKVVWGPAQIPLPLPEALRGSVLIGDAAVGEVPPGRGRWSGLVVLAALLWMLNRTKIGLPDPRRRAGPGDGREPRLPDPAPLRRRVRRRLGARRPRRRALGHEPADRRAADRRPGQRAALHRHHHRRPRLDARLPGRRAGGGPAHQLRRLPRTEADHVLEHRPDGRGADLAAAGPLSRDER
jgi:hypothetical protein